MKIEQAALETVTPYVRNPRNNSEAVAKVAASIKEYGWRQPIAIDKERVIIAGHTRLLALQRLGLEKVPVHVATGLTFFSDPKARRRTLCASRAARRNR